MKKNIEFFLIGLTLTMSSIQASAMVVDHLRCEVKGTDFKTGLSASSRARVDLVRKLAMNQAADRILTVSEGYAEANLITADFSMNANININVEHGVLLDQSQQVKDSRQTGCVHLSGSWCKSGEPCLIGSGICKTLARDPFDAVQGWRKVDVINGTHIPQFDVNEILEQEHEVFDVDNQVRGKVNFKCKYEGTDYDVADAAVVK